MDLKRIRGPLVAAISTLLLAGAGSVALATNPSSPPAPAGTAASQPESTGADTDLLQVGDQTGDESGAQDAAGAPDVAEADAGAPDNDNVQDESGAQDAAGAPDVAEADAGAPDNDNIQDESGAAN